MTTYWTREIDQSYIVKEHNVVIPFKKSEFFKHAPRRLAAIHLMESAEPSDHLGSTMLLSEKRPT